MNYDMLMDRLQKKLDASYQSFLNRSSTWSTKERKEHTEEIQDTKFAYSALLRGGGTQPELRYLLRFKDPLRIVADQVGAQRILGCAEGMDQLEQALWRIFCTQDTDSKYELEQAFQLPEGDAEECLGALAGRAESEYQAYLTSLEQLSKTELIQRSSEIADMEYLVSIFVHDSYDIPKEDLCFICREENLLRAFYDFLYHQDELSMRDSFKSILTAYNEKCEEAVLTGEWEPAAPAEECAPLPDDPEGRAQFLHQRIKTEYEALEKEWLTLSPASLIEKAQDIADIQLVQEALSDYDFEEEDLKNLLCFPDLLSKVAGYWSGADRPTAEEVCKDLPYVFSSLAENESCPEESGQEPIGGLSLC